MQGPRHSNSRAIVAAESVFWLFLLEKNTTVDRIYLHSKFEKLQLKITIVSNFQVHRGDLAICVQLIFN